MRGTAKISLLLAVTAALWLGTRAPSMANTASGMPSSTLRVSTQGEAVRGAAAKAKRSSDLPPARKARSTSPTRPSTARENDSRLPFPAPFPAEKDKADDSHWRDLDDAPEAVIRHTLTRAVGREQRNRPLFVSMGVIEQVASERGVRVIFDTRAADALDGLGELLSGGSSPTLEASWEGLRLFPLLEHAAAFVGPQALLHLIESDGIEHIELDAVHRPSLDLSIPLIRADLAHEAGEDGDGFAIAILDTGVDTTHPMLAARVLDEACFSTTGDCPNGESEMFGPGASMPCRFGCNHGTLVAGIAAGEDAGEGLVGTAPHASIIPIQIFSNIGGFAGAYSSDILAGLQHVLALTAYYDIAVVNLSFGGTLYNSEETCDRAVASQRAAIALLRNVRVATVAAAGNEHLTNAMTTPACLSNVIGVGSSTNSDLVSTFSNSASFLSLLAPGESIESSANGGGTAIGNGTSMATPHVAGAIAILREAIPEATVDEIENALALSGVPVLDTRNGITTPRIRVDDAVALLSATADPASSSSGGATSATVASNSGSGGGSSCGLIGIEPFLVLAAIHLARRRPRPARGA